MKKKKKNLTLNIRYNTAHSSDKIFQIKNISFLNISLILLVLKSSKVLGVANQRTIFYQNTKVDKTKRVKNTF